VTPNEKRFGFGVERLDGTPVNYTGTPGRKDWASCTNAFYSELVAWIRQLRYLSHTYGNGNYATLSSLTSQGFYVPKDLMHGQGRAMDLASVQWNGTASSPMSGAHKSTSRTTRRRYYAVEAVCRRQFRYVLDGYYNGDHADHLHCDDSALPTVIARKGSRADALFVQGVCNNFLGTNLAMDGDLGPGTNAALDVAKSRLQVTGDVYTSAAAFRSFCERVAAHGFRDVGFGFYTWPTINGYYSWSSLNFPDRYIRHRNGVGYISAPASAVDRADATWKIKPGLAGFGISLESRNFPGHYLRHQNGRLKKNPFENTSLFKADATFRPRNGLWTDGGSWRSLEAWNFPGCYVRHRNGELWLDRADGTDLFHKDATFSFRAALA
jgi:hypothetical protein